MLKLVCVLCAKKKQQTIIHIKLMTTKIAVYGHGTGGYIALGMAYLDKQAEMELPKFVKSI
jgi:acetyl esterase/lipase